MSLKIIGGEYGGRVLRSVKGIGTRPLLGQVREALFNILQQQIPDAIVWDLFAGTGASGIEALSRGAARVMFCEKNGRALDVLRGNLQMLGPDAVERSVVQRGDAWDPPPMLPAVFGPGRDGGGRDERDERDDDRGDDRDRDRDGDRDGADGEVAPEFAPPANASGEVAPDVIFLDPPYALVAEDPVKSLARARRLLDRTAHGGCVVFHFETGALDEDDFDDDLDVDLREWGSTAIAMMWRRGEAPERLQRRLAKEQAREDG
jgi:16S rRNA G966 N2-methylase RsmD